MRIVLQCVASARVTVDGELVSEIGRGVLLFVGIHRSDTDAACEAMARKVAGLRIFEDAEGKMNRSCEEIGGELLAVSQFTLLGDLTKGKRPGFDAAMKPPESLRLYDLFCDALAAAAARPVKKGRFGASMKVHLVNDGPATFVLET